MGKQAEFFHAKRHRYDVPKDGERPSGFVRDNRKAVARAVLHDATTLKHLAKGDAMSNHTPTLVSPISALRHRLNMTQEEFAHAIGVTVSTVNRWENGHIEPSRLARKAIDGLAAQAHVASMDPPPAELAAAISAEPMAK